MSVIETRRSQMFPVLDALQLELAKRFASAPARTFRPGEVVFDVGQRNVPTWLVLEGSIEAFRRDGLGHEQPIAVESVGQFSGEISQLAGRVQSLQVGPGRKAARRCQIDAAHLCALLIGSAELGEMVMRALILRRVGLLEGGGSGAVLVGRPGEPNLVRLQGFLARNAYPNTVLDATDDAEGHALLERFSVGRDDLPLV